MAEEKDKPISRFEAQRKLGLLAPHDYVMGTLIILSWAGILFWKLIGDPSILHIFAAALVTIFLTQCLLIVLAYRIIVFLIDVLADINLMPEAAARIVIGYWQGKRK